MNGSFFSVDISNIDDVSISDICSDDRSLFLIDGTWWKDMRLSLGVGWCDEDLLVRKSVLDVVTFMLYGLGNLLNATPVGREQEGLSWKSDL